MRLERGMEGGREKSEKDDSEAGAKLCLAARSRKAKARLQRPGDGGKAQSASEERSHASTTRPQALAQALAPRLALVGCLGGALVGLALAQGSTKARQGLVVPWLMETHQG